ncbi:glycosyl transferase family 2 [filamentous cyanobacterium CCP5]|nr:glycosyl transferase family 2 [filamentous cyanobacterium CCP5]
MHNPKVSVIIPAHNDSERLRICLRALAGQSYPRCSYEVIVVDNNSQEDVKGVVSEFMDVTYSFEGRCGSYAARNKGIALASGEIVAFTDSDCVPSSDWLEKGVSALQKHEKCGLAVGNIELFFKDPNKPTAVELYESVTAFKQKKHVELNHWGATANIFTYKSVIAQVGTFDSTLESGGDVEWGQRIFAAGYAQVYAEDCIVRHPARHSFRQLSKKMVRVAGGRHDLRQSADKYPHHQAGFKDDVLSAVARALRPPIKSMIWVFSNENLKNLDEKLKVLIILLLVRYVSAWTNVRLSLISNFTKSKA